MLIFCSLTADLGGYIFYNHLNLPLNYIPQRNEYSE